MTATVALTDAAALGVSVLALLLGAYNALQQRGRDRRELSVSCQWAWDDVPDTAERQCGLRVRVVNVGRLPTKVVAVGTIHDGGVAGAPDAVGLPLSLADDDPVGTVWFPDVTELLRPTLGLARSVYVEEARGMRRIAPFPAPPSEPGASGSAEY